MKKLGKSSSLLVLSLILCASTIVAQSPPPGIFITDLTSGPDTGGENVGGKLQLPAYQSTAAAELVHGRV